MYSSAFVFVLLSVPAFPVPDLPVQQAQFLYDADCKYEFQFVFSIEFYKSAICEL